MRTLKKISAALLSATLLLSSGYCLSDKCLGESLTITASAYENQSVCDAMLKIINKERANANLKPLKLYPVACERAAIRAKEIATSFSHTRPDGSSCFSVLDGIPYSYAGENIAYNHSSDVQDVMTQWMNSSGHKANILNASYTHVGIGVYQADSRYYWSQDFLGYSGSYSGEYIPSDTTTTTTTKATTTTTKATTTTTAKAATSKAVLPIVYSRGDVDGNSSINAGDASIILSYYSQLQINVSPSSNSDFVSAADVNKDNEVNAVDASLVLTYYSNVSIGISANF